MISAKLFNTEKEFQSVEKKLLERGIQVKLNFENTVACEVSDHITGDSIYLVASSTWESYGLKGYFITKDREYLIDCGIRMILNYLYNSGYEVVSFMLSHDDSVLVESCTKIGLKRLANMYNQQKLSITAADFYKSTCQGR